MDMGIQRWCLLQSSWSWMGTIHALLLLQDKHLLTGWALLNVRSTWIAVLKVTSLNCSPHHFLYPRVTFFTCIILYLLSWDSEALCLIYSFRNYYIHHNISDYVGRSAFDWKAAFNIAKILYLWKKRKQNVFYSDPTIEQRWSSFCSSTSSVAFPLHILVPEIQLVQRERQ